MLVKYPIISLYDVIDMCVFCPVRAVDFASLVSFNRWFSIVVVKSYEIVYILECAAIMLIHISSLNVNSLFTCAYANLSCNSTTN